MLGGLQGTFVDVIVGNFANSFSILDFSLSDEIDNS